MGAPMVPSPTKPINGLGSSLISPPKSGFARRRPFVDLARRPARQLRLVAIRQLVVHAERIDPLLVGQDFDRARPVGAPQAAVKGERAEDAAKRLPDVLIRERLMGQRARAW